MLWGHNALVCGPKKLENGQNLLSTGMGYHIPPNTVAWGENMMLALYPKVWKTI